MASTAGEGDPSHRPWWRQPATLVAVLGLLVTLVFNTVGVWAQFVQSRRDTTQAKESKAFTEIGVLTQLASEARMSERAINSGRILDLYCQARPSLSDLSVSDHAALRASLGVYDYMAWLFNEHRLDLASALALWGPRIVAADKLGAKLYHGGTMSTDWPQLTLFRRHADRSLDSAYRCPKPLRPPP